MTPEGKVKKKVKAMLNLHGAYYFMPVQQGYGASGLDFHGVHKGRGYAIECKAPGRTITPRQKLTKHEMEKAGTEVFVIGETVITSTDGPDGYSGMVGLETWLLGLL
jgi:hypothetical protein